MNNEELLRILNDIIVKNLGHATAYGYAKSKGYTGTEEEFAELMADYAHVAQDAEAAAQSAAESATAAHNSEVNAGNSEGLAEQAKLDAQASAQAADVSEANAKISELNADTHAENAEAWAVGTRDGSPVGQGDPAYHNNAKYYAELADTKADQAADSAEESQDAAVVAQSAATSATASATAADASKVAAKASEDNAKDSEDAAKVSEQNAKDSEDAAKTSEDNAKASENTASNAAVSAMNSRDAAAGSATNAAGSASTATQKASEASQSATSASGSAATATQKATDASNSASAAAQSAAEAEEAATHVADMALMEAIAEKYKPAKEYKVGNLLTYLGKQYYCIADAPAGTPVTNTEYFEEKSVADIIEMIKNGSIVTGHSEVADNLTPYSEDSGTVQSNPFISQGTGTDNNSVIVTTGTIARQLEKQGNTIVKNQLITNGNFASNTGWSANASNIAIASGKCTVTPTSAWGGIYQNCNVPVVAGHKYLLMAYITKTNADTTIVLQYGEDIENAVQTSALTKQLVYKIVTASLLSEQYARVRDRSSALAPFDVEDFHAHDLTQWFNGNDNIPADLLAHPEHFSWYYNGSMSYDAGSLQNCNGKYLECGQGRNLFDQECELGSIDGTTGQNKTASNCIRSKNYIMVVPNKPCYLYCGYQIASSIYDVAGFFYDKDFNYLGITIPCNNTSFNVPANARYFRFFLASNYGTVYRNDISIEEYYTPAEGGEGYGEMHDYIAPIRIDTGNETLKAFDKKLPSGVIGRNTGEVTNASQLAWQRVDSGYGFYRFITRLTGKGVGNVNLICEKYALTGETQGANQPDKSIKGSSSDNYIFVRDDSITTIEAFLSVMANVKIQYELAEPTTEQGTPFDEYIDINDYSYMCWFDTDGNLVSIPQGLKIQYPVNYKGFTDDLYMRTNGDAGAIALGEELTDEALNARGYYKMQDLLTAFGANGMVGGTLRQTLCAKESLDFENTECADLGDCSWSYNSTYGFITLSLVNNVKKSSTTKMLSTLYEQDDYTTIIAGGTNMKIGVHQSLGYIVVSNSAYTDATAFKNAMKGVLLAFEKAST